MGLSSVGTESAGMSMAIGTGMSVVGGLGGRKVSRELIKQAPVMTFDC